MAPSKSSGLQSITTIETSIPRIARQRDPGDWVIRGAREDGGQCGDAGAGGGGGGGEAAGGEAREEKRNVARAVRMRPVVIEAGFH